MSRRGAIAGLVLVLWLAGVAALAHRQFFRGEAERLAQAALLIAPGGYYYAVMANGEHVGYASSTVDTIANGISVRDVMVADVSTPQGSRRLAARSRVMLSRGMRLRGFLLQLGGSYGPYVVRGAMTGDTLLTLTTTTGSARPTTTQVRVQHPLLMPTVVPIALALEQRPKIGREYAYSIYDPLARAPRDVTLRVRAESLFVLGDSAVLDGATERWREAHQDTVRGWRIEEADGGPLHGWVDEKGRLIQTTLPGRFALHRTPYELAFQNWDLDAKEDTIATTSATAAATAGPRH